MLALRHVYEQAQNDAYYLENCRSAGEEPSSPADEMQAEALRVGYELALETRRKSR